MTKYVLRFASKDADDIENIRSGKKWVETRAGSPKYKNIRKGDILVLRGGNKKLEKIVLKATHFTSVDEMLKLYKVSDIAPNIKDKEELKKRYLSYPNYRKKLKRYGVLAFEV